MGMNHDDARALCEAVAYRLAHADPDLSSRVRAELPSYTKLPDAEHRRTVQDLTRQLLEGMAAGVGPSGEALQFTRRAARRRAQLGVSAYDVLKAFHIVSRELWNALQSAPEATDSVLIALVEPMGRWTEAMTASVVDAFVDESPTTHAQEAEVRRRFFGELGDRTRGEYVAETARALAFDIHGQFQAICSPRSFWPDAEVESLQRATRRLPGVVQCGVRASGMYVLVQDSDVDAVVRSAHGISGTEVPIGIGLRREGLHGAHWSIVDAERTLRVAEMRGAQSALFFDTWLESTLLDSEPRLALLFDTVQKVRHEHPDLAAAVFAFAEFGFSQAQAAKELHLHPNSIAYRLNRWKELTGADPRTFSGLARSIIGCRIEGIRE
ncbi:hypothetical protein H351_30505 (plasmid) [Rhodococcus erythropolis R138]|nr:hypothetical protein H351_30505 [Rhodococcus erythropolis R138]